MIHFANSGGKRPMTEPATMQINVRTSCFQYGKKNDPKRFQSTLRSIFGLSGLNIDDHIMWLGPPPPSIFRYNPLKARNASRPPEGVRGRHGGIGRG